MRSLTLLAVLIASSFAIPIDHPKNALSNKASKKRGNSAKFRSSVGRLNAARADAANEAGKSDHGNLVPSSDHRTKIDVIKDVVEFFKNRNIDSVIITENNVLIKMLIEDKVINQEDVTLLGNYNLLDQLFIRYGSLSEFIRKEFGGDSDKEHDNSKERGESSGKEHDKPKESGENSDKKHEEPKGSSESSDKEHDKPKGSSEISDKKHEEPKESGDSSDIEHDKPKESGESSDKEHDKPKESSESSDKKHEEHKESGESSDIEHDKPKESGESSDKKHEEPKESGDSSDIEHDKPKETERPGHEGSESPSDHRTKSDVIEDVVEFFYNNNVDNLAISENSILIKMLIEDRVISQEDVALLGNYSLLYELFIRYGSLNEFIGKEFGGDSDKEDDKSKEDDTEGKIPDEEEDWKGWGDNYE